VCYVSTGGITPGEEDRRRERAISHAQQAIALDPLDPRGHWLLGMLLQMRRDFAGARFHLDRAMTLSPGDVETLGYTGLEYAYAGEPERGIGQAEQAIRLNPYFPPVSAEQIGKACFIGHRYDEALFWLRQTPDRITTNRGWLAAAAAYAGRLDEAASMPGECAPRCNTVWARRNCGPSVVRSDGSGYRPGFSMQPTWSTTSAG
jgi:tetratricopeptide (TPR) repeat protein